MQEWDELIRNAPEGPDSYRRLRLRVEAVDCPRCKAPSGIDCQTTGGYHTIHKARMNTAAKLTTEDAEQRIAAMLADRSARRAASDAALRQPMTPERRAEWDAAQRAWMSAGRTNPTE